MKNKPSTRHTAHTHTHRRSVSIIWSTCLFLQLDILTSPFLSAARRTALQPIPYIPFATAISQRSMFSFFFQNKINDNLQFTQNLLPAAVSTLQFFSFSVGACAAFFVHVDIDHDTVPLLLFFLCGCCCCNVSNVIVSVALPHTIAARPCRDTGMQKYVRCSHSQ